jgi:hypothetical protein
MNKMFKLLATFIFALILATPISAFAFGAIAVDDEEGELDPGVGFVTGEASESDAKAGALKQCRALGNKDCKIAGWFKECGAYAGSRKYSGFGFGSTKKVAEARAMDKCGDPACKIIISECE